MKQSRVSINLDGLKKLKDGIGNRYVARVGVLGSGASRGDGITNSELAIIHIFGSVTRKIPPRDFLMMPIEMKKREILQALGSSTVKTAFENDDYKRVLGLLGAAAEAAVQEAFETGGFGQWPKLKDSTIKAKGSDSILIDRGELRKSVSSDVVSGKKGQGSIGNIQL